MKKLLTRLVSQYRAKHGREPAQIVVSPVALVALAAQRTVAPRWMGIPVMCREIKPEEAVQRGPVLGIDVKETQVVSFDLATA